MGKRKIDNPDELTSITAPGEEPEKEKAKSKRKGKTLSFSEGELTQKIYLISKIVAGLLKLDFDLREKDFSNEGATLARMCDKWSPVGTIVSFFDPIYLIGSLVNKFTGMKSKKQEQSQNQGQNQQSDNVVQIARGV